MLYVFSTSIRDELVKKLQEEEPEPVYLELIFDCIRLVRDVFLELERLCSLCQTDFRFPTGFFTPFKLTQKALHVDHTP